MSDFHVAVDHIDPVTLTLTTTYLGTCDQAHADEVRAIAALPGSERFVEDHPHIHDAFLVLRDDGDLDAYVPVDATEYRVYAPDPEPRLRSEAVGALPDSAQRAKPFMEIRPVVELQPAVKPARPVLDTRKGLMPVTHLAMQRGATSEGPAYIDGVVRFGDQVIGGAMDTPNVQPRVVWHTTESPAGKSYSYSVAAYLIRVGAEPQVIYDPATDLLGQFGPLTQSGRALRNDGARRTNREGRVNVQVEALGRAASPWTKGFPFGGER